MNHREAIIVFDLQANGHHPEYLQYLWDGFQKRQLSREVIFIVHSRVAELLNKSIGKKNLSLRCFPEELEGEGNRLPNLAQAQRQVSSISIQFPDRKSHLFFPYLNSYLRVFPDPAAIKSTSGILFSPASAAWGESHRYWPEKIKSFNEVRRIRRSRAKANLEKVFLLNDTETATRLSRYTRIPQGVERLSDPVGVTEDPRPSSSNPASPSKITFLLLGALRPGKGVLETLKAFSTWKPTGRHCVRLILVGAPISGFESVVRAAITAFHEQHPTVALTLDLEFLTPDQLNGHLSESDFILLPYLRPLGSSGLLGHAARTGKPVLASKSGLIGKLVRDYSLGATFEPSEIKEWHRILDAALAGDVQFNPTGASKYLQTNSVEAFQNRIIDYLTTR